MEESRGKHDENHRGPKMNWQVTRRFSSLGQGNQLRIVLYGEMFIG